MLTHDATWDALIADNKGFRPAVKATAWRPGSGSTLDVPVTDGWVLKDAGQYPRTHVSVTCADTSLVPRYLSDLLQPNGACLAIDYGYTDPATGTTTWLRIADGPITQVTADRPGGVIQVESADPSVGLTSDTRSDAGWGFTYLAGTTVLSVLTGLANTAYAPSAAGVDSSQLTAAQAAQTIPTGYTIPVQSRWEQGEDLADLIGAECYYRPDRYLVIRPTPTGKGVPAFAFMTGPKGTITDYQTQLQRPVNQVILRYGGAAGVIGTWQDLDPNSPTYSLGSYGFYTVLEDRDGIPSQAEANAAAKAYAMRLRGDARNFTVRAVPVPWLEPGDPITVSPVGGVTENHIVQSVSIPLGLDVMTLTTRNPTYSGVL